MAVNRHNNQTDAEASVQPEAHIQSQPTQAQPTEHYVPPVNTQVPPQPNQTWANQNVNYNQYQGVPNVNVQNTFELQGLLATPVDDSESLPRIRQLAKGLKEYHNNRVQSNCVRAKIDMVVWNATVDEFINPCVILYSFQDGQTPTGQPIVSFVDIVVEVDDYTLDAQTILGHNNTQLAVPVTLDATVDKDYTLASEQFLREHLKEQGIDAQLVCAGTSAVYSNVDLEDEDAISDIYYAATKQCVAIFIDGNTGAAIEIARELGNAIRQPDLDLRGKLIYKPKKTDPNGLPIYADLCIDIKGLGNSQNRNRNHIRRSNKDVPVGSISVMADVINNPLYNPNIQPNAYAMYPNGQQQTALDPTKQYMPLITVTDVSNTKMMMLPSALLSISSLALLTDKSVIGELYKPNPDKSIVNVGDIGSIGYLLSDSEGTVGQIPLDSVEYTADGYRKYYDYVASILAPSAAIAIDVPNLISGPNTIATISSSLTNTHAYNTVVQVADTLTNGLFSQLWAQVPDKRIVLDSPLYMPLGYFIDGATRAKRDLRELNNLAAIRHSGVNANPDFLNRWMNTSIPGSGVPTDVNLGYRIKLMAEMVGGMDNLHVKGYAWRYYFTPQFIATLANATRTAGVSPNYSGLYVDDSRMGDGRFSMFSSLGLDSGMVQNYANATRWYGNGGQPSGSGLSFYTNPNFNEYYSARPY